MCRKNENQDFISYMFLFMESFTGYKYFKPGILNQDTC